MDTSASLTRELLAAAPLVRDAAPHALLRLAGPDAADFLQRLQSQDVAALGPGALLPAAFLDGKGKLAATCLLGRDGEGFLLETQAHQQQALLQLLDRYHFTEKLTFAAVPGTCRERVTAAAGAGRQAVGLDGGVVLVACARRGVQFERWHLAPGAPAPRLEGAPLTPALGECLRMVAGFVKVGVESEPNTLALEAVPADHFSPTKGCYTGQEIVARIHTYGHTNRQLCLLLLAQGPPVTAPVKLHEPEERLAVGRVVHAVPVEGRGVRVGVGYLPEDFRSQGTGLLLEDGAVVTVLGAL